MEVILIILFIISKGSRPHNTEKEPRTRKATIILEKGVCVKVFNVCIVKISGRNKMEIVTRTTTDDFGEKTTSAGKALKAKTIIFSLILISYNHRVLPVVPLAQYQKTQRLREVILFRRELLLW